MANLTAWGEKVETREGCIDNKGARTIKNKLGVK